MENEKIFEENFRSAPKDFGPVPFWFLNNELPEEDIDWFLQELVEKGNSGVFLHPRTGLEVEYLSQSFWDKISYCIEACRKLGLKAWLYDEYNWPSGVAGGRILREHPEYAQHYLDYRRERVEAGKMVKIPVNGKLITAVAVSESGDEIICLKDKVCGSFLEFMPQHDNWYVAVFTEKTNLDLFFCTTCAPWVRNERGYLDLLSRDAVRCFINYTHEEYKKRLGRDFGDLIPGIFTDEPANYRGLPWTGNFLEEFKKRKGYSLEEKMHELAFNVGEYVKTRCDYFSVVSELFSEAFYGQIGEWCRENGLKFSGHLFEEEELETVPRNHGNVYTALMEMDIPGLDWLGVKTGYEEIPLIKAPCLASKIVSSIAHATGKKFVLCEYGGGNGWNTTLMSLKNLVNFLQASGVTFMNSHAAYLSIKGLRKRDFPPSHFVQEPWWKHYATFSSYISRLSYLNSSGTHVADVLLLYPLRSLWAEYTLRGKAKVFEDVVKYFGMIGTALLRIQRDYDILFEDEVLDNLVSVDGDLLRVADEEFRVLILPPMTTIPVQVLKLVGEFYEKGGIVVSLGFLPTNSDTKMNDPQIVANVRNIFSEEALNKKKSTNTSSGGGWAVFLPLPDDLNSVELEKILRDILNSLLECDLSVDSPHSRNLIYLHRRVGENEFYFVANLSEEKVQGEISLSAAGRLEKWVPETGEILPVHVYRREKGKTIIPYIFEPYEGVYFVVRKEKEYRHLTFSNVNVTGIDEEARKIWGYSRVSEPKVIFEERELTGESPPLLEPIIISKWSVEVPTNYMVLEPWKVIVGEDVESQKGEKEKDEKILMVGRYAPMEEMFSQLPALASALGLDLREYCPFEVLDFLEEKLKESGADVSAEVIPLGSSYQMTAEFEVKYIPERVQLVYEDLGEPFQVYINDSRVEEKPQRCFLWDKSNRSLEIKRYLRKGRNKITIKTRYPNYKDNIPTSHAIEPVVLAGKFAVVDKKIDEPKIITQEKTETGRGIPNYSGDITLKQKFNLDEKYLEKKLMLECQGFRNAYTVKINGKNAGTRLWPPHQIDITELVQMGENTIEITITNTAENLLGTPPPTQEKIATITPHNKHLFTY